MENIEYCMWKNRKYGQAFAISNSIICLNQLIISICNYTYNKVHKITDIIDIKGMIAIRLLFNRLVVIDFYSYKRNTTFVLLYLSHWINVSGQVGYMCQDNEDTCIRTLNTNSRYINIFWYCPKVTAKLNNSNQNLHYVFSEGRTKINAIWSSFMDLLSIFFSLGGWTCMKKHLSGRTKSYAC